MTNLQTNLLEVLTREAVRYCSRAVRLPSAPLAQMRTAFIRDFHQWFCKEKMLFLSSSKLVLLQESSVDEQEKTEEKETKGEKKKKHKKHKKHASSKHKHKRSKHKKHKDKDKSPVVSGVLTFFVCSLDHKVVC